MTNMTAIEIGMGVSMGFLTIFFGIRAVVYHDVFSALALLVVMLFFLVTRWLDGRSRVQQTEAESGGYEDINQASKQTATLLGQVASLAGRLIKTIETAEKQDSSPRSSSWIDAIPGEYKDTTPPLNYEQLLLDNDNTKNR